MSERLEKLEDQQQCNGAPSPQVCAVVPKSAPRAGERCPRCTVGVLDYDGMLNLTCPECKFTEGGCFT